MILSGNVQNHVFHSNSGYSSIGCAPSRISRPSREVRPSCGRRCTYRQRPSGCGVPTCRPLLRACCCSRHKTPARACGRNPPLRPEVHPPAHSQQVPLRLQFFKRGNSKGNLPAYLRILVFHYRSVEVYRDYHILRLFRPACPKWLSDRREMYMGFYRTIRIYSGLTSTPTARKPFSSTSRRLTLEPRVVIRRPSYPSSVPPMMRILRPYMAGVTSSGR